MQRSCAACEAPLTSRRSTAMYCGPTCRQRAHRARLSPAGRAPASLSGPVQHQGHAARLEALPEALAAGTGVLAATRRDLDAHGVTRTPHGQVALLLAERIDHPLPRDTAAGLCALVRELRITSTAATAGATRGAAP